MKTILKFTFVIIILFGFIENSNCQTKWWQREIATPSANQIINPNYLSKKRELEKTLDDINSMYRQKQQQQRLGHSTKAADEYLQHLGKKMNTLEYELSKIPVYITNPNYSNQNTIQNTNNQTTEISVAPSSYNYSNSSDGYFEVGKQKYLIVPTTSRITEEAASDILSNLNMMYRNNSYLDNKYFNNVWENLSDVYIGDNYEEIMLLCLKMRLNDYFSFLDNPIKSDNDKSYYFGKLVLTYPVYFNEKEGKDEFVEGSYAWGAPKPVPVAYSHYIDLSANLSVRLLYDKKYYSLQNTKRVETYYEILKSSAVKDKAALQEHNNGAESRKRTAKYELEKKIYLEFNNKMQDYSVEAATILAELIEQDILKYSHLVSYKENLKLEYEKLLVNVCNEIISSKNQIGTRAVDKLLNVIVPQCARIIKEKTMQDEIMNIARNNNIPIDYDSNQPNNRF